MNILTYEFFLKEINDSYANLLLLIVAIVTVAFAYWEYVLKRKPIILAEMAFEEVDDLWYFHFLIVNCGSYTAYARVKSCVLSVGDEIYPTKFEHQILVSPNTKKHLIPIGHINSIGRQKIRNRQYKNNQVAIDLEIDSKPFDKGSFNARTVIQYIVDVSGQKPVFGVQKEFIFKI